MEKSNHSYITLALAKITPNAEWTLRGDSLENLEWLDKNIPCPTEEELEKAIEEVKKEEIFYQYREKRLAEYPPFSEYLDAIVKNDDDQLQKYIDSCLKVKEKYPKPEEL